jgi:hypothetical protein
VWKGIGVNFNSIDKKQELLFLCLQTRNGDGYIRQYSIEKILCDFQNENDIIPFIAILIGEYIEEILKVIYNNLKEENWQKLKAFFKENPKFFVTTEKRIVSYWNCYYKKRTNGIYTYEYSFKEYVGFKILNKLRN